VFGPQYATTAIAAVYVSIARMIMSQCDPARGMNGLELLRLIMACITAAVIGHSPRLD
jgi:hypothetical protein